MEEEKKKMVSSFVPVHNPQPEELLYDYPRQESSSSPNDPHRYPLASSSSPVTPTASAGSSSSACAHNSLVWNLFQDAAANTSRLYQARAAGREGHWTNFQNAASSISMLYKESLDAQERSFDAGYRSGVEKAYNELMDWLVQDSRYTRCKTVRVEDLVNFVYSPQNPATFQSKLARASAAPGKSHDDSFHRHPSANNHSNLVTANNDHSIGELEAFRDALHISSLSGAMSHFSVNRSPPRSSPSRSTRSVDLHAFVTEEMRRHKRTSEDAFDLEEEDEDSLGSHFKRAKRAYSPSK